MVGAILIGGAILIMCVSNLEIAEIKVGKKQIFASALA